MTDACRHLFAYGTLRADRQPPTRSLLTGATLLGFGETKGTLYDLREYPGMADPLTATDRVHGQVYLLARPHQTLASVDRYEGCSTSDHPPLFTRRIVLVKMESGRSLKAWAYFYQSSLEGATRIASGDYMNR